MNPDEEFLQALRRLDRPTTPSSAADERVRGRILGELTQWRDAPSDVAETTLDETTIVEIGPRSELAGRTRYRRWARPAMGLATAAACLVVAILIWSEATGTLDLRTDAAGDGQGDELDSLPRFCATDLPEYLRSYEAFQGWGIDPERADRNSSLLAAQEGLLRALETAVEREPFLAEPMADDLAELRGQLDESRILIDGAQADPVVLNSLGTTQVLIQRALDIEHPSLAGCQISALDWRPTG